MSVESVWVVVECFNPIQLPIITYNHNNLSDHNGFGLGKSLYKPLWPEPNGFSNHNNFQNIHIVGVYSDYLSAQKATNCAPNRKLLGPTIIQ
jgi:hypothetical protein